MSLFTLGWKNSNPDKAVKAVSRIKDQQKLFEIILDNNAHYKVREAAAERLTDQALIYQIVMNPSTYGGVAIERLTDQALLCQIARQCGSGMLRKSAAERIEDMATLRELAETDPDWEVRETAYRRLGNDAQADTLVARLSSWPEKRKKALKSNHISSDVLKQICLNDRDSNVRDAAFIRLTDEADIAYVAANSTYRFTREWALEKMPDDQRVFFKAAKKYQSDAALERLDPRGLFMLFLRYKDVDYSEKVGKRLLQLSEKGCTDWIDNVDDASLQTLAKVCFEKRSVIAAALLKLIYKNGRFAQQIHLFNGRTVRPEYHIDVHHDHYELGDHVDMGHTDTIKEEILFQLD